MKQYLQLCADFETTVYNGQKHTEVWSAAVVEIGTEDVVILQSIEEFFQHLFRLRRNIICYFHNLKFDGSFILDYLLRTGYNWNRVKDYDMMNKDFKCSISDRGAWYTITVKRGGHTIEFRDSLKLLPFSLKRIGESFKTKHRKLEMEYTGYRYAGCDITTEEREYIKNDVLVLSEALEFVFNEGHRKLTIGSCCLDEFKHFYDKEDYSTYFPDLTEIQIDKDIYGSSTADAYIRKSYKGGYCYLVKGKENIRFTGGWTADINSSYPSNMSSESGNYYPVGKPTFWRGNYIHAACEEAYWFVRIRCRFQLKDGMLPTIQIKGNLLYPSTEYLETSDVYDYETETYHRFFTLFGKRQEAVVTMTLTCVDYMLFLEHYNVYDLEILDGCFFRKKIGLFDEYMYKYKSIKESSKGAVRELAKLYLNNLYGKFASNDDSSYKKPYLKENGVLSFELVEEHDKKAGHIAIGSAITSYARRFVINAAQANYHGADKDGFIYCDTDSIHCSGSPEDIKGIVIHPTHFCAWKVESYWDDAIFVRQKTYIEHVTHNDGEPVEPYYNIRCAGMSETAKAEFKENYNIEDFREGLTLTNMLHPVRLPGGIVLENKGYKMSISNKRNRKDIDFSEWLGEDV